MSNIEQLTECLSSLLGEHHALLELAERKKEILIRGPLKELATVVAYDRRRRIAAALPLRQGSDPCRKTSKPQIGIALFFLLNYFISKQIFYNRDGKMRFYISPPQSDRGWRIAVALHLGKRV